MKGLYEKTGQVAELYELQRISDMGSLFPSAISRKLYWFICSIILNTEFDYERMDSVIPVPRKPVSLKACDDIISIAMNADNTEIYPSLELENLDCNYRGDVLSDGFISDFQGKYWRVSTWENTCMVCGSDTEFYHFKDFFNQLSEVNCVVTRELLEQWKECLRAFISDFLPSSVVDGMANLLLNKRRELFFSKPCPEQPWLEVFNNDFEYEVMEEMINILRFPESKNDAELYVISKQLAVEGLRERFHLDSDEMTDQEVYDCFKALYDQPLMVEFCDMSYSLPVEYALFKSKSLGLLLSERNNADFLSSLSLELQKQLVDFYESAPEDNIIFPYQHQHNDSVDIYVTEKIYICGMYTSLCMSQRDYVDVLVGGTLLVPSLEDVCLLKWADELYDAILDEKRKENEG